MSNDEVSADVAALLRDHVETYEQLETLAIIGKAPGRRLGADELASRLGIPASLAVETLEQLSRAGLLEEMAGQPPSFGCAETRVTVLSRLAAAYAENRLGVMTLMTNNALERLRTTALRSFSNAFLIRRKRGG